MYFCTVKDYLSKSELSKCHIFQSEAQSSVSLESYEMVSVSGHQSGIRKSWGDSTVYVLMWLTLIRTPITMARVRLLAGHPPHVWSLALLGEPGPVCAAF